MTELVANYFITLCKTSPDMEQPKLERLLRIMKMLTANDRYSIEDIASRMDMSSRTIYRYIDTFRDAGFVIKKSGDRFKIDRTSPYFKDISQLVHFTEEEAYILKNAIESISEVNTIKENLKRKLYSVYDYKILADVVVKGQNASNVHNIIEAIEDKQQIRLKGYSSSNSGDIKDRVVEPFAFTANYIQVWAYEPETCANKMFRISRIGQVELLDSCWQSEDKHQMGFLDIFRYHSTEQHDIKLILSLRAKNLIIEEFPLSEKCLTKQADNSWLLTTKVCGFDSVCRFIMGLLEDIEIIEPTELKYFVRNKIKSASI